MFHFWEIVKTSTRRHQTRSCRGSSNVPEMKVLEMKTPTLVALLVFGAVAHAQPAAKSTAAGVFTEEQAKRGKAAYNRDCGGCHGADLVSTDREVSNLTGDAFKRWNGKTVGELFEVTRDTMPPREERSLDNQVYLDMVAYILQFNKAPSGNQELKPDIEILKQIVIAPRPG
jgi:mono/diheme cytochrome c family protein